MTRFRRILVLLNELKRKRILDDYAIGGGVAAYRYLMLPTKDLDVFVILHGTKGLIDLSPIWGHLRLRGYSKWQGQWIVLEGYPTEFIPADELEAEAIKQAHIISYERIRTKVMRPEYLIAIFLRAGRLRDKMRVQLMLAETPLDATLLNAILSRFNLLDKLEQVK